jgi:molecular chaperone DnaK
VYSTERTLAEPGANLPEADRRAVEQALSEAREALKGEDSDKIRRAKDNLTRVAQTLAEAMRRQSSSGANGGQGGAGGSRGSQADDVVDAEFKDANDPKS